MTERPILVVGAGPVGLVLASELRRGRVPVRLIDSLSEPSPWSKAVAVHARTLELLARLGIADRVADESVHAVGATLSADGKTLAEVAFEHVDSAFRYAACIPQDVTESILHDLLVREGGAVERSVELVGLEQDDDGVRATVRDGDGVESEDGYAYAVGCDGGHSTIRRLVGTALEGSFDGSTFLLIDCDAAHALARDRIYLALHPEGLFGLFPLPGERVRLIAEVRARPEGAPEPTLADAQRLSDERMDEALSLRDARWIAFFEIHEAQVPSYRFDRVFLAGDAAHVHSPAGGQGMNTGIQDAVNLAWKLRLAWAGAAAPGLLDSYHAERHPVGAHVVRNAGALTSLMTHSGTVTRHARDALLSILVGHTPLSGKLADQLAETSISYRNSPIVSGLPRRTKGHGPLHPGDLAPIVGNLEDAVDPTVHTALLFGGADDVVEHLGSNFGRLVEPVRVDDPDGQIAHRYGAGPGLLAVVRPDGYLAYLGEPDDLIEAERTLSLAIA